MSINKCIVTKGIYNENEYTFLVSFDEEDKPVDIVEIEKTAIGQIYLCTVEKVLKDINGCILKLDDYKKGFIDIDKLDDNYFVKKHSKKNPVSQNDSFYVKIYQEKKDLKPYTCDFVKDYKSVKNYPFLQYYINNIASGASFITDLDDVIYDYPDFIKYEDDYSLWSLYEFTKIIDKALSKRTYLSNDSNIVIEATEAMTVIDINTGKGKNKKDFYETNCLAAKEILKQLRLRSISGIVVIDFLKGMTDEEKASIIDILKEESKKDYCKVEIFDFTSLGLLEITRSKKLSPLSEFF